MAPDHSPVALLLIDVINDLEFEGADDLVQRAVPMARRIAALKKRARAAGIPIIYANDNFGRWQSDFHKLVEHVLQDDVRGREVARILEPDDDDYFVLKPKHSAFFSTTLHTLLDYLGTHTVIITGISGNICVLFSANDAYMRDLRVIVPADCTVSNSESENRHALDQMKRVLKADIRLSTRLDLKALKQQKSTSKGSGRSAKATSGKAGAGRKKTAAKRKPISRE